MPLARVPEAAARFLAAGRAPEGLADRKNLLQLVHLRWVAVAGQLATILFVHFALGVPIAVREMLALLGVLAGFNVLSWLRTRLPLRVPDGELLLVLLVDVAVLAGQLYFSGGIGNPFIFLFLLQVALASVLLPRGHLWVLVSAASLAFAALTRWHRPLPLEGLDAAVPPVFLAGLLVCFVLNAGLLVIFIGRISRNLQQRDAALARLRQRAVEEEHIVRMGLLASGAAHELGTPLATLSVILGDWSRMAPFAAEPELREEIEEMQRQIDRCKAIVTGILTSAGETRGDAPKVTTLHAFLDTLVDEWQRRRGGLALGYSRHVPDLPIISDTALRQMIHNVLDNALEAAPDTAPRLEVTCTDDQLLLGVQDRGPGFGPEQLERLGTPYQSSKGTPGRGLGLFLSVNVARALGGSIEAQNLPGGGAVVRIALPLAALVSDEDEEAVADGS